MPTPDSHDPHKSASSGYEITDANVFGVGAFMASMGILTAVLFVVCFGIGRVINTAIVERDGPPNKWNSMGSEPRGKLENMTSSVVLQQQELRRITQRFPEPRLETDNGDLDVAEMHAREDLLLDHYSWVDRQQGKVRIPIARAMELIAQRGLPVAPATTAEPLMTADKERVAPAPLTDGFARTGFEQQYRETIEQQRSRGESSAGQADVGANR